MLLDIDLTNINPIIPTTILGLIGAAFFYLYGSYKTKKDNELKEIQNIQSDKEKIKAFYFGAAHTNGDAIIHFQHANIAHMGDLVFNRRYAFVDRSAGANIKSWIQVLEKTLQTFDGETIFIFGHAFDPVKVTGNKEDLKAMQNYLSKLLEFVSGEIKAGKSKEEIIKATSIPGAEEWKGDGIERGLTAAYEELTT